MGIIALTPLCITGLLPLWLSFQELLGPLLRQLLVSMQNPTCHLRECQWWEEMMLVELRRLISNTGWKTSDLENSKQRQAKIMKLPTWSKISQTPKSFLSQAPTMPFHNLKMSICFKLCFLQTWWPASSMKITTILITCGLMTSRKASTIRWSNLSMNELYI